MTNQEKIQGLLSKQKHIGEELKNLMSQKLTKEEKEGLLDLSYLQEESRRSITHLIKNN